MRPLLFFPPHRFIPLKRSIEREDYPIIDDKRSRVKILNFPDGSNRNTKIPIDSCCAQVLRDSLRKVLNPTFKIRLPKPFQKNFPLRVRESQFATLYPGNREEREEDEWTGFHAKFQREVALSRGSIIDSFVDDSAPRIDTRITVPRIRKEAKERRRRLNTDRKEDNKQSLEGEARRNGGGGCW